MNAYSKSETIILQYFAELAGRFSYGTSFKSRKPAQGTRDREFNWYFFPTSLHRHSGQSFGDWFTQLTEKEILTLLKTVLDFRAFAHFRLQEQKVK